MAQTIKVPKAIHFSVVEVTDPDTLGVVLLSVAKDPLTGGIFAIDETFLDQVSDIVSNPFAAGRVIHIPEDEEEPESDPNDEDLVIMIRILHDLIKYAKIDCLEQVCSRLGLSKERFDAVRTKVESIVEETNQSKE